MRVLVTRPATQAAQWVALLRARAIDAHALPLIEIAAAADPAPLHAAWRELGGRRLVFFVSPNAASQFFAERPPGSAWPLAALAGSTGPGTTRVLVDHQVPPAQIIEPPATAPQFDSEALWLQLQRFAWQGERVLIVRGERGRDWLAQALDAAGAQVEQLSAYRRLPPRPDPAARRLLEEACARPAEHLWFFSSSEAIANLEALVAGVGWPAARAAGPASSPWHAARAIVTHPRIAAQARQFGFGRIAESRPALEAVAACIQSMQP